MRLPGPYRSPTRPRWPSRWSRSRPNGAASAAPTSRRLWDYREVLWAFTVRAVKVKYKQAVVGVGWALVQPVLAALIFALIFGRSRGRFDGRRDAVPAVRAGGHDVLDDLRGTRRPRRRPRASSPTRCCCAKVYFPREAIPLGSIGAALVELRPGARGADRGGGAVRRVAGPVVGDPASSDRDADRDHHSSGARARGAERLLPRRGVRPAVPAPDGAVCQHGRLAPEPA